MYADQFDNFDNQEHISPREYLWAILKRKWLVLFLFGLVVFVSVIYTIKQPKIYASIATVEIDIQADRVLSDVNEVHQLGDVSYYDNQTYYQTQYDIIKSNTVAEMVVKRLHLDNHLVFLGLDKIEDDNELQEKIKNSDPVAILQSNLMVIPRRESRLVDIRYTGTDPQLVTTITNTIAEAYIEQNLGRKLSSTRNAINWLTEQIQDLKTKLEDSETALYQFRKDNNIISIGMGDRVNIIGVRLEELSRQVSQAEQKVMDAKSRYMSTFKGIPKSGNIEDIASVSILENPLIKELKTTLVKLENSYSELLVKYKEKHPDVQLVKSQMDKTRKSLRQEISNIINGQKSEYLAAESALSDVKKELEQVKEQAMNLTSKSVEYNRLLREQESNQRVFEQVLVRLKEIDLAGMLKVNNISMLDEAKVPTIPITPKVKLNIILGIIMGLAISIGTALLLEVMDKTLKNTEDVERFLKIPLLGVIPKVPHQEYTELASQYRNFIDIFSFLNPQSSLAECCRTVRTNISFMSPGKQLKRILVTSASPREGKTTIVSNLSITIAKTGKKVLVLDSDIRRPRIHKAFDTDNDYGLSNVIMGTMTIDEAIRKTPIENLDILTCGAIPPNPAELLGSEEFRSIVDSLDERYDWIFFDSPPVIAVTDSSILSGLVDGVILVVKHGKTLREVAIRAKKQMTDIKANLLGAILNDLDLDNRETGNYYYHYYHRYGYYHHEPNDNKDKKRSKKKSSINAKSA